jgi:bifunctional enzyme CysN/CysC
MSETPSEPRGRYLIKHLTKSTKVVIESLLHRIDVTTLHRDEDAERLELNDIGRVTLRTASPLAFDPYAKNRTTGSFIVVDETTNDTVAAGMLLGPAQNERSTDVTWDEGRLTRERRWAELGARGATLWFTGLPASGKSTIAAALEARIVEAGVPAYRLDGDNLRHGLNANLGFSPADRAENVRRTAEAAKLLADAGTIAIASLVSPYAEDRAAARRIHEEAGLEFVEVFVDTPLAECERRDPKGLYAKARAGELPDFTGISAPYEAPDAPDLRFGADAIEQAVEQAWQLLVARGILTA